MNYNINIATNKSTGMFPLAQLTAAKRQLKILLSLLPEGSTAYIAGGAPRDWHHGWGCRDVDIFYHTSDDTEAINKLSDNNLSSNYGYNGYGQGEIISVHERKINQGSLRFRKIQYVRTIIDPMLVIKTFPLSLSQIWMDTSGQIKCSNSYRVGYNQRTIIQVNNSQYIYPYLEKILPRFTNYGFYPYDNSKPTDPIEE